VDFFSNFCCKLKGSERNGFCGKDILTTILDPLEHDKPDVKEWSGMLTLLTIVFGGTSCFSSNTRPYDGGEELEVLEVNFPII